jgi:hypothetical protein
MATTMTDKATTAQVEDVQSPADNDIAAAKGNYEVKAVQDSRYAAAVAQDKPHPLSKSLLLLYPILFVAFMNSAANGFDGNTFGGVSALPDFENRFGTNVAASQGFLAALYILGKLRQAVSYVSTNRRRRQRPRLVHRWSTRRFTWPSQRHGSRQHCCCYRYRRPSSLL